MFDYYFESVILNGSLERVIAAIEAYSQNRGNYPLLTILSQDNVKAELAFAGGYVQNDLRVEVRTLARVFLTRQANADKTELRISDDDPNGYALKGARDHWHKANNGLPLPAEWKQSDEYLKFKDALIQELIRFFAAQADAPKQDATPAKPGENATREEWYQYKYKCDQSGVIKFTHEDLAERLSLAPGTVRRYYADWIEENK